MRLREGVGGGGGYKHSLHRKLTPWGGGGNPLPKGGFEPASVLHLAFQSDTLPTDANIWHAQYSIWSSAEDRSCLEGV